jgi:hypothetical protein
VEGNYYQPRKEDNMPHSNPAVQPFTVPDEAIVGRIVNMTAFVPGDYIFEPREKGFGVERLPAHVGRFEAIEDGNLHVRVNEDGATGTVGGIAREGDGFRAFVIDFADYNARMAEQKEETR